MKAIVLAVAAAAALGFAAPASAHAGAPRGIAIEKIDVKAQDFSARHRRHHWGRHHVRHCKTFWRHGRRVTVCRR